MKHASTIAWVALLLASNAVAGNPAAVLVNGEPFKRHQMNLVREIIVNQEVRRPDECELRLGPNALDLTVGSSLEIQVETDNGPVAIFQGEIVSIEPIYNSGGQSVALLVRGFDKSHRLSRGVQTRIWRQVSEADLFTDVAAPYGLRVELEDPGFQSEFVYQNNQTDLEFLRQRAARIGFLLDVEGDVLRVVSPTTAFHKPVLLESFRPLALIDRDVPGPLHVVVRGWDYLKKEKITGEATGDSNQPGDGISYEFQADELAEKPDQADLLVFSRAELEAITRARLQELIHQSWTALIQTGGQPSIKPGVVVKVNVAPDGFGGEYFVQGVTHTFSQGGYTTTLRILRDAEGGS